MIEIKFATNVWITKKSVKPKLSESTLSPLTERSSSKNLSINNSKQ